MDGLIAVCGLKAVEALPEIVPLLNHAAPCVISDACPTVEVLGGGKEQLEVIEPLIEHGKHKVQRDSQDAILTLKVKPLAELGFSTGERVERMRKFIFERSASVIRQSKIAYKPFENWPRRGRLELMSQRRTHSAPHEHAYSTA
jgi:hypothetical protein